jgi:hypothetical protein
MTKLSETPIRFIAPEATVINCVSWKDYVGEKYISVFDQNKQLGSIQKNVSQIKFCITGQILNNEMIFNCSGACYICINIMGDL